MKVCPKCKSDHSKNGIFCSRKCANSRAWSDEDKQKKSDAYKKFLETNAHPSLGKPGWKHSDEMKELKRQRTLEHWDKIGRRTAEELAAQNRANVQNHRARQFDAVDPTADLHLIKRIMLNCPDGYEVDHIVSLTNGGKHHENNLQYLPSAENKRKGNRDVYNESLVIKWQDILK